MSELKLSDTAKFQWSVKLDNGEIYVCVADSAEDLGKAVQEIRTKFLNSRTIPEKPVSEFAPPFAPATTFTPPATASPSVVCNTCGAKAFINEGTSKAGRPYKIQKCSKFPELTTKGGHSFWMK